MLLTRPVLLLVKEHFPLRQKTKVQLYLLEDCQATFTFCSQSLCTRFFGDTYRREIRPDKSGETQNQSKEVAPFF